VMPIVTYGLHLFAHKLKAKHLVSLDVVKNRYLKKALSLPMRTGNEFVYTKCETKRLGIELHEKGYNFEQCEFQEYLKEVEGSIGRERDMQRNNVPDGDAWRGIMKPRHYYLGFAAHGFHHRMCQDRRFHLKIEDTCTCRFCDRQINDSGHLE